MGRNIVRGCTASSASSSSATASCKNCMTTFLKRFLFVGTVTLITLFFCIGLITAVVFLVFFVWGIWKECSAVRQLQKVSSYYLVEDLAKSSGTGSLGGSGDDVSAALVRDAVDFGGTR